MSDLTILSLCLALANLTDHRCSLVENSNTCRCIGDSYQISKTSMVINSAPQIMLSEVFLIFFVLGIWLSAIVFCLNQYKSLRRLETQVHYCVNRKDPVNIGEIKIVTREQDSIIYKKKRYSTLIDTQIDANDLKTMHYVQQYLPKQALVMHRDEHSSIVPTEYNPSNTITLPTHEEECEEPYFHPYMDSMKRNTRIPFIQRAGSARYTTSLTVPRISPSASSHSAWTDSAMYGMNSTQHLSVPSNNLGSNYSSSGDITFPVPQFPLQHPQEQLLDPRLISATVRRSLLALHRESQENVNMLKKKDKTRSETDVHGVLMPLKIKLKTLQQQFRPHSNTLSILPGRQNSIEHDQHLLETVQKTNPIPRRTLKHYPKYATQSGSECDPITTTEPTLLTSVFKSIDDEDNAKT